jgi:hypothetical protein
MEFDPVVNREIVERLRGAVVNCNLNHVPQAVRRVIETKAWRERYDFNLHYEFKLFSDFITQSPVKGGMGWKPELVEGLLLKAGDVDALTMWREAITGKKGKRAKKVTTDNSDNITIKPKRGTSRAYTLARLKREKSDLYERVKAKELSANAAAIEAGWRTEKSPAQKIMKLLPKVTRLDELELIRNVIDQLIKVIRSVPPDQLL